MIWVRAQQGLGRSDLRRVIALPWEGYVAVAGDFAGTLGTEQGNFAAQGPSDCWVSVYTPTGGLHAFRRLTGSGTCTVTDLAGDPFTRFYVAADFTGAVTHGASTVTTSGPGGVVARFNSFWEGFSPGWVTTFGGSASHEGDAAIGSIAFAADGNLLVGGKYLGGLTAVRPVLAGQVSQVLVLGGGSTWDLFLVALDGNGVPSTTRPLRTWGGPGDDELLAITAESDGSFVLAGSFTSSQLAFGSQVLTRRSQRDAFFGLFRPDGSPRFLRNVGVTSITRSWGAAMTPARDRFAVSGVLGGTASIDDQRQVTSAGNSDGFLAAFPVRPDAAPPP